MAGGTAWLRDTLALLLSPLQTQHCTEPVVCSPRLSRDPVACSGWQEVWLIPSSPCPHWALTVRNYSLHEVLSWLWLETNLHPLQCHSHTKATDSGLYFNLLHTSSVLWSGFALMLKRTKQFHVLSWLFCTHQ